MYSKIRLITIVLFFLIHQFCGFSQTILEGVNDHFAPELDQENYPTVALANKNEFETNVKGEKIIIPEGISGFLYVVFDAPPESDYSCCPVCEFDFYSNLIVNIPKSRIYRYTCDGRIHEKMLTEGRLQYLQGIYDDRGYLVQKDSINGYQIDEYLSIKSLLKEKNGPIDLLFDVNSVAVVPLGFHESFKEVVERELNKEISGNVAGFQIGKVKDIFNLAKEDYKRIKH